MSFDVCKVRQEVMLLRRRFPDATSYELAEQAFSDVRLRVVTAGAAMGLAANPLLSVAGALADLSVTTRAQLFAAACAAELLIPGFLDSDTARYELLVPVLGSSLISQLAVEFGLKAAKTATRDVVVRLINQRGLRLINAVITRVFGRRVTHRALITKTIPLVGCLIGGAWNAMEVEVIRNRTLRYLTDQFMEPVNVVDVEAVSG
ncbi:hypothetical protein MITS9509_00553 [Synechococcus sp. MIT S9509]|nr:hypothetical protein MITS9504_00176 [Synechococcus sp. MIT S9504]KZR93259.1 hypothetical protein MITS9509_00553 [Synechococcus sp. MIT S9509]